MSPPNATYRLQLTEAFDFDAAAELVPYLRWLGISHLYVSPVLRARSGSTHGYDMVDPNQIDPRLGGETGYARLCMAVRNAQMGIIVDFVPNHMGIGKADNTWWLDILEWGPASRYACFFDIDWFRAPGRRRPTLVLPILGRPYGEALSAGEIVLKFDPADGSFSFWYYEHRFPIRPQDYGAIIRKLAATAGHSSAAEALLSLATQYPLHRMDYASAKEIKAALTALPGAGELLSAQLEAGQIRSDKAELHRLLARQHYLPTFWRGGAADINFRRFFDINDLAGLRIEDPAVFDAVHRVIIDLLRQGSLQGIRIDHVDGLRDPVGYCDRLGEQAKRACGGCLPYIVVEKILGAEEELPPLPYVAGTTGYEWMNVFSRLLVRDFGLSLLDRTWRDFTGEASSIPDVIARAKVEVLENLFGGEFTSLVRLLHRIALGHRRSQDFSAAQLAAALRAYLVELPVYRTYVTPTGRASDQDRAVIVQTIAATSNANGVDSEIAEFLCDVLTLDIVQEAKGGYSRRRVMSFVAGLQQLSGPVMAKAVEDTGFYRVLRLLALNEVGGDPDADPIDIAGFHAYCRKGISRQPSGMIATATHDTKRGEDARMRLVALSELAEEWNDKVIYWRRCNEEYTQQLNGRRAPSRQHEYLLYQALLGGWPISGDSGDFHQRFAAYAIKAARESKQETSWRDPDSIYEDALHRFARTIADPNTAAAFMADFLPFVSRVALLGALNSLSQTALKVLLPGVPDIYQGTELWDLSFVDPDNRRPVDFSARRERQDQAHPASDALARHWSGGLIKFALLQRLLTLRAANPALFSHGGYEPLAATGTHANSVVAFSRHYRDSRLVVVVGRLMAAITDDGRTWPDASRWADTTVLLPEGGYEDLAGDAGAQHGIASLQHLMWPWPVAILGRNIRPSLQ